MNLPQAEVIALDTMRAVSPGYTPKDLDVPAFMRKGNDVMQEIHEAVCFRVADDPGTILSSAVPARDARCKTDLLKEVHAA